MTTYRNRITSGPGITKVSARTCVQSFSIISALSESTKQIARRAVTIESGSKVALSTSALLIEILSANANNSIHRQLLRRDRAHRIESKLENEYIQVSALAKMVLEPTIAVGLNEITVLVP